MLKIQHFNCKTHGFHFLTLWPPHLEQSPPSGTLLLSLPSKANSRHFSSQNISVKPHCPSLLSVCTVCTVCVCVCVCVCVRACVCACVRASLAWCVKTLVDIFSSSFFITFFISMYIMCVCFFSALSCRVGALHISILIIITKNYIFMGHSDVEDWNHLKQSIKNIVSSVREMCTVSFNCHQNVAIGMKTIPQSTQKCYHRSPTTKKWKHALLPEPFNHWPLACIYMRSDMGLWCDRHRCVWRDWLKKCVQQCCAAPNNVWTGKNNTVHKIWAQKRLKGMLFIRTKHNM